MNKIILLLNNFLASKLGLHVTKKQPECHDVKEDGAIKCGFCHGSGVVNYNPSDKGLISSILNVANCPYCYDGIAAEEKWKKANANIKTEVKTSIL